MNLDRTPRFWRSLLLKRQEARWGNFSWVSASVLLQSANDQIAKHIDATIVNRRRMRLVANQRAQGIDVAVPIELPRASTADGSDDRTGAGTIVLLGDPGEMDASQYVLLSELYATEARTLVLMSDIVYPGGNVNAWRDAVYLPYFGLPRYDWDKALHDWREGVGGVPDDALPQIPPWRVFATPGNHDWYDGLNGFMFNACRGEPLPNIVFSGEGLTVQQGISRALWQRAARPDRAKLEPIRVEIERRTEAASTENGRQRASGGMGEAGPLPRQPGPYFAIEVPVGDRSLLLVSIDTGIDGSIDVEQALWARDMLAIPDVPKVVITGKPLAVDDKLACFPIDGGEGMEPGKERPSSVPEGRPTEEMVDLRDLMRDGDRVIATIAGDVHNYQRMVLRGDGQEGPASALADGRPVLYLGEDERPVAVPGEPGLPPLQLVTGGGGAYLTETHKVEFDQAGALTLRDERNERHVEIPACQHTRYPSREESVLLFGRNLRPWVGALVLGLSGLGATGAAFILGHLIESAQTPVRLEIGTRLEIPTWQAVLGAFGTVGALALIAFLFAVRPPMIRSLLRSPIFVLSVMLVAGLFVAGWGTKLRGVPLLLAGALLAALLLLLLVLVPLLRSYPRLRRLFPARILLAGAGTYLALGAELDALPIVGALLGLLLAYFLVKWLVARYREAVQRWVIEGTNELAQLLLTVGALWPVYLVVAVVWLGFDWLEAKPGDRGVEAALDAIRLIAVTCLWFPFAAAALVSCIALWRARRTAPTPFSSVIAVAFVATGAAALYFVAIWFPSEAWYAWLGKAALAVHAGAAAAIGLGSLGVGILGQGSPSEDDVREALKSRDERRRSAAKSMALFRVTAISHVPAVGQLAEATHPPFYKSFTTLKAVKETSSICVTFETFGVKDERHPGRRGHPASQASTDRGSYPVDRVSIRVPDAPADTRPAPRAGRLRSGWRSLVKRAILAARFGG